MEILLPRRCARGPAGVVCWCGLALLCLPLVLPESLARPSRVDGPRITNVVPSPHTNDANITSVALTLSEPVVESGARDAATYTLLALGADRAVGGGDDSEVGVTPAYVDGSTAIELQLVTALPEGLYQLTARGGESSGLRDPAGNPLDQDQDGTPDDLVTTIDVDLTGPTVTAVQFGTALTFGDYDYVELPAAALNGTGDLTIEFWLKTTNTSGQALVSGANNGDDDVYQLWLKNGSLEAAAHRASLV